MDSRRKQEIDGINGDAVPAQLTSAAYDAMEASVLPQAMYLDPEWYLPWVKRLT